jgi:hypothetical protein
MARRWRGIEQRFINAICVAHRVACIDVKKGHSLK